MKEPGRSAQAALYAWGLVLLMAFLFLMSLAGSGTGLLGGGRLTHLAWSWIVLAALIATILALLRDGDEPRATPTA